MGPGTSGGSWGKAEYTRRGGATGGVVCVKEEEPEEFKKLGKGTKPGKVGGGTWERLGPGVAGAGLGLRGEVCRPKLQLGLLGYCTSPLPP